MMVMSMRTDVYSEDVVEDYSTLTDEQIMAKIADMLHDRIRYLNQYKSIDIELWQRYRRFYKLYTMTTGWYIPCNGEINRLSIGTMGIHNRFCVEY